MVANGASAGGGAGSPVGMWSAAVNVPGTSPVTEAEITDVSCAPGAECVAAGAGLGADDASFIISERNGAWGKAALIPGLAKLGGGALITSVSCPASGDCLVAGQYGLTMGNTSQGWYAQEVNGTWGNATPIPGLAHLNTGGFVESPVAACPSPGNCVLAGSYGIATSTAFTFNGFTASETGYTWTSAAPVPGLAGLVTEGSADVGALSCASPGNCALGGSDESIPAATGSGSAPSPTSARTAALAALGATESRGTASNRAEAAFLRSRHLLAPMASSAATPLIEPFVASEVNGVWQPAQAPALGLTSTGDGFLTGVACPAAGACIASGFYDTSDAATAQSGSFLVSQSGSTWSRPSRSSAFVGAIDCRSASTCAAAVLDARGVPAVVAVVNGTWGKLQELPGAASLTFKGKKVTFVLPEVLACPTAGNCSVGGGSYIGSTSATLAPGPALVASEANGTWSAIREPGTALGNGAGGFWGMACASAANCAAGGLYSTAKGDIGAFIMVEVPARATATTLTRSHSIVTYGAEQRELLTVTVTAKLGTPAGRVTVKTGTATVCVITLKAGTGSCVLTASQFKPGPYHLMASYGGNFPYGASTSPFWPLTVQA